MRDPENYRESYQNNLTRPAVVKLQSEEDHFRVYLQESPIVRRNHGVDRVSGKWVILNPEMVKNLPRWKKEIIRSKFAGITPEVLL